MYKCVSLPQNVHATGTDHNMYTSKTNEYIYTYKHVYTYARLYGNDIINYGY